MKSLFICLLLSAPLLLQAQPESRPILSLAGQWNTTLGAIRLPGSVDESRLAPANPDSNNTGQLTRRHPFVGKLDYTRTFSIPAELETKEWTLFLERTKPSVIVIDGDTIGTSSMILTPQIFRIGKLKEGQHTITISIDNSESAVPKGIQGSHAWTDATQTNWNGIIGRMELQGDDGIRIDQINVYPTRDSEIMPVQLRIGSDVSTGATLAVRGHTWNTPKNVQIREQRFPIRLIPGEQYISINVFLGHDPALWSEFDPALYRMELELIAGPARDYQALNFGVRDFSVSGTRFSINGKGTFLRGKNDGCVFPLTGYPPMEKEEWKKYMLTCRDYGINHIRFHSWTPPQAAFEAADELGIYLQPELPYWGTMHKDSTELNNYLMETARSVLTAYGNSPSFVMMAMGNELRGDQRFIAKLVDSLRMLDNRRKYALGSNNALGTAGQQAGDDFFVTCRVGGKTGTADYSTHARASFSFADAVDGGILNGLYPSSDKTFRGAVEKCTVPVVAHETGQYQIYPNYDEIQKYTGVLYPHNFGIFRKRIAEKGMLDQAADFHRSTARFAEICYKEDIEICLRTGGFGGFQLLDLQDYPGQGTALIGLLDAFMDAKAGIEPQNFRKFCSEIVPLAYLPKYCWNNDETLNCRVAVFNFSNDAIQNGKLEWELASESGSVVGMGHVSVYAPQGNLTAVDSIAVSLAPVQKASKLKLTLRMAGNSNSWDIWVYPNRPPEEPGTVYQTRSLADALRMLKKGRKVLLIPKHEDIRAVSVGGMFTPDYWNYAMFKSISERLNRTVSPGTLGLLINPDHPLFKNFPTEFHSNWQWWSITKNSRPMILDNTVKNYRPLIQVIDNVERNHKLGLLYEFRVGKGKLLVSMCDFSAVAHTPEGLAFRNAIIRYMNSAAFSPETSISETALRNVFQTKDSVKQVRGVENISTYE